MSEFERTIDRIRDRLQRVGVSVPSAPLDGRALGDLARAIEPLQLPDSVTQWWRTVDVETFPVSAWPRPCDPALALTIWRSYQDEFVGVVPRCLVPVAYESHVVMSVEAEQPGSWAGEILRWAVDDWGMFRHVLPSFSDLLESYVDVIDSGAYEIRDEIVVLDDEAVEGAIRARSADAAITDRYPAIEMHFTDASQWPAHWQRSNGSPTE